MIEWLILIVAIPSVVVPVVMLVGFAGCGFSITFDSVSIDEVVGASGTAIDIRVTYSGAVTGFRIGRTRASSDMEDVFDVDGTTEDIFVATSPSHYRIRDSELEPDTTYSYRVRAIHRDGEYSDWSQRVPAATFPFITAFRWKQPERDNPDPTAGWAGRTLVQRIAGRLSVNGEYARLTLRAGPGNSASIDRVFISSAEGDPYDSAANLTEVTSIPFVIPVAGTKTLTVKYHFDVTKPLLIIVEFSTSPGSSIAGTITVPDADADAYYKDGARDAAVPDRNGYTAQLSTIRLIEQIDVA